MRATLLLVALSLPAFPQTVAFLESGTVEINGFGGFAAGLGRTAGGFGANLAVAANKWIMPYGEFTYFPDITALSISRQVQGVNATGEAKVGFRDFHGGVHIRIPPPRTPSIVPYFALGAGVLSRSETTVQISGPPPVPNAQPISESVTEPGANEFAFNGGIGIRFYTRENVGFRVEFKGYKPTGGFSDPFFKLSFGVFLYLK